MVTGKTLAKITTAILAGGLLCVSWPLLAQATEPLRVCADPDNLPFSSSDLNERGLYLELAEMIARRLGIGVEYFWWRSYFGKRTLRNTLLSDRCDAYFGLPYEKEFMAKSVALTRPFLNVGYAIVAPEGLSISQLDDLKGKTVGVQFRSQPQLILSARDGFQLVTFRLAEQVMHALARQEVESAFVWGPVAGYYNKRVLGGAFQIVPVQGLGLQWQVAVGVKKGNEQLKAALERELQQLQPDILRLADKYGFPLTEPVNLDLSTDRAPASPEGKLFPSQVPTNPVKSNPVIITAGRSLFNQYCSHCHSPNAMNPEPRTDLRRLKRRYGKDFGQVFYTTVTRGRQTKGMPPWEEVLSDGAIWKILTFLESVQNEP